MHCCNVNTSNFSDSNMMCGLGYDAVTGYTAHTVKASQG